MRNQSLAWCSNWFRWIGLICVRLCVLGVVVLFLYGDMKLYGGLSVFLIVQLHLEKKLLAGFISERDVFCHVDFSLA